MPRLLLGVLLAGLLYFGFVALRPLVRHAIRRKRIGPWAFWIVGVAVVGALFWRFGWHWLVVAGSLAWAALRRLLPLLRFLPFVRHLRGFGGAARGWSGAPPGATPPGSGGSERRAPPSAPRSGMSRGEALEILGLDPSATRDDVEREYRRLMKKLHPDVGGSGYLAGKLNQAREVLLS